MITTEAIEIMYKADLWYLFLVSLISSDTLLTVRDCKSSLSQLEELEEVLPKVTEIPNDVIEKGLEFITTGKQIVEEEMKRLRGE